MRVFYLFATFIFTSCMKIPGTLPKASINNNQFSQEMGSIRDFITNNHLHAVLDSNLQLFRTDIFKGDTTHPYDGSNYAVRLRTYSLNPLAYREQQANDIYVTRVVLVVSFLLASEACMPGYACSIDSRILYMAKLRYKGQMTAIIAPSTFYPNGYFDGKDAPITYMVIEVL